MADFLIASDRVTFIYHGYRDRFGTWIIHNNKCFLLKDNVFYLMDNDSFNSSHIPFSKIDSLMDAMLKAIYADHLKIKKE